MIFSNGVEGAEQVRTGVKRLRVAVVCDHSYLRNHGETRPGSNNQGPNHQRSRLEEVGVGGGGGGGGGGDGSFSPHP